MVFVAVHVGIRRFRFKLKRINNAKRFKRQYGVLRFVRCILTMYLARRFMV